MNKKNVAVGVLVTGAFLMSLYTIVNSAMDEISRQTFMYSLKQEQLAAKNKINSLSDNYNTIDESLTYYDVGIAMNMNKIDKTLSALNSLSTIDKKVDETLLALDSLSTIDKKVDEQLKALQHTQQGQAAELLEIRGEHSETRRLDIITVQRDEPQPIIEAVKTEEPEVIATVMKTIVLPICPRVDKSVDFDKHLKNLTFRRAVKFTTSFDIQGGEVINITFSKDISRKLNRAVTKYLNSAIPESVDVLNCSISFTIAV